MSLILYYSPGSIALASLIALHEAGLPFEARRLDFSAGEQRSPDYLRLNPKGRVPALVTERGVLTETPAILGYVAQMAPEKRLAPADPFDLARLQAFNAYLCSTVHVAHAHRYRGIRWADLESSHEDMKRRVPGNMAECFRLIEEDFFSGPWVMGNQYTVADPYLFTIAGWLEGDGVDVATLPRIAEHMNRMRERPAVRAALADVTD